MSIIGQVAVNGFKESVRDKVLYNLVAFATLLIAVSYLLGQLTAGQDVKIIIEAAEVQRVTLDGMVDAAAERSVDIVDLNQELDGLSKLHERQARVVELRFFGGLSVSQTAEVMGISTGTVDNDWAMARAWLTSRLSTESKR